MPAEPVVHYARSTGPGDDARIACGPVANGSAASTHAHEVTCPDCRKVIVQRVMDKARLAVLAARASWAQWASDQCRDADGGWLPGAGERWRSLIPADFALSGAEAHIEAAIAHLTGQSPLGLVQPAADALEAARRTAARMPEGSSDAT
jgi:hypothetical protein